MENLNPPIFAAILGAAILTLQTLLMLTVGMYRNSSGKGVGVDGDMKLERLVRRHGNLAENAAIFIIVFALYEILFGATTLALVIGATFVIARVSHVVGFTSDSGSHLVNAAGPGRVYIMMRAGGAGLTALSTLALGLTLLVSASLLVF